MLSEWWCVCARRRGHCPRDRHQILACFKDPYVVDGTELRLAAKIGIALFPTDARPRHCSRMPKRHSKRQKHPASGIYSTIDMNARAAQCCPRDKTAQCGRASAIRVVLPAQDRACTGHLCGVEPDSLAGPRVRIGAPARFIPLLEETGMNSRSAHGVRRALRTMT